MKIFRTILLVIIIAILLFIGYLTVRYISWEKDFFNDNENLTCINDENYEKEKVNILERVENFVMSDSKTELMTFSRRELLFILRDALKESEDVKIENMCLLSDRGVWRIYVHPKLRSLQLPWIAMDIVKDDRETVELYSSSVYVGDIKIPAYIKKKFSEEVNRGISDALILMIENKFLGKTIQNIDLLKDSIMIKGVL